MNIKVKAYGIAKDIIDGAVLNLKIDGSDIASLKTYLCAMYPEFEKLKSLRFAVNADYQDDHFILNETDEVVIIPPVSGG